jgi:2-C-methyl-D-erythritol 4-phosphate cytidylyltransferase
MRTASEKSAAAVVAAGGVGSRMGGSVPKQLLPVGGEPVIARALRALDRAGALGCIVVSAHASVLEAVRSLAAGLGLAADLRFTEGGRERQDTVARGLEALPDGVDVVLVHDAARPFASPDLIRRVLDAARVHGAAVPALPARNTVKRGGGGWVEATLDRSRLYEAQTPQGFRRDVLVEAYARAAAGGAAPATDDAALVERLGLRVRIVPGEERNIKITTPLDLALAEALAGEDPCA